MGIYNFLFNISKKMRRNKLGKIVYDILEDIGIRIVISRIANWSAVHKNEKQPNSQMKNSRNFFKNNKSQIKEVLKLLEDEESKICLRQMIMFRCYSRYKDLPYNSMRKQYFINNFFHYTEKEKLIDCGAYDGDSIINFKRVMKKAGINKYQIVAFEPDKISYSNLLRNHPGIIAINTGVWSKKDTLLLGEDGSVNSTFIESEKSIDKDNRKNYSFIKVPVRSIDDTIECKGATFIKMDIEGSEFEALNGAKKTICTYKPKLAICIYHSDEDMLRIIKWIHELVPEYRLYVRQHSNSIYETVLYAIC